MISPQHIHDEMDHSYATFVQLTRTASRSDLKRPSDGTRWTNEQLLFHMMFGYLIVRRLLPIVRFFDRLPDQASRSFAALLNAGTRALPSRQLCRLSGRRHRTQPHPSRGAAETNHRSAASRVRQRRRIQPSSGDAFPGGLGPIFQRHDDFGRRLPLRNTALRPSPCATHARLAGVERTAQHETTVTTGAAAPQNRPAAGAAP